MGCAYIEFDSETNCYNITNKLLVIGDTLVHWVPTDAKECHFCYQIEHLGSNCPTLLKKKEENTKKNVPEEPIKIFGGRSYAEMAALNPSSYKNNANPTNNKKGQQKKEADQPWRIEIDELRQQVNEMAKLLNAKKNEDRVVNQPPSHISEEKKGGGNKKVKQDMFSKHNLEEKKEAYNPEKEINDIKKALKPIIILLKQVEKQGNWNGAMAGESKSIETDDNIADNNTWKIGTINVRELNNPGKAEEFDFVVITETKLTPFKEKGMFFGTGDYHTFWESSTEKQIGTGVGILVKKCWTHHVELLWETIASVGLYMSASKSPTEKAVAKEIRKLLANIVQNKEIVMVAGNLNKDLASKLLEKTIATNKEKKCPIATLLQQMNMVNIHGMYAASNGVQRRLDYVFTNVVTASLITNIGVINVNESFSTDFFFVNVTDHKAVVTIIQSDRILAGTKEVKTDRLTDEAQRKSIDNSNDDLNQMWLTIKETVLQAAECLPKRKVEAQSTYTKKECINHKLVKVVADIIKQIRANNTNMHDYASLIFSEVNLIANIMQIMEERSISFKSFGDMHGIPESSRPHAHLIETVIALGATYTKVRGLLRKKTILYLHQSDSGRIPSWFKILIPKYQTIWKHCYFIDLILDSGSSISVIAKHFLEAIGRKIDEPSTRPMTNVHGDKKKGLGIAKAIPVHINDISIETDMEVSEAKKYTIIVGNEWLKKAKALLDYELCELIIRCGKKLIVNQEEEQSEESDDEESDDDEEQKEQKKTAELAYTTFTSNGKPLDNVKADREGIIVNGKLICWPYYDILRRTFDQKPNKKAKYHYWWHGPCAWCWCNQPLYSPSNECKSCLIYYKDWEPISLIPREELKEVQKSFENEPPEIQSLVVEQRKPSSEERKIDIENLLARNSPVISKEGDIPG
ncbi:hypothetical protein G9A89_014107 [Geosiphon pyriformis]|nr:hypothetical protein G9A89_014107 [Geosiphon pyriformis]